MRIDISVYMLAQVCLCIHINATEQNCMVFFYCRESDMASFQMTIGGRSFFRSHNLLLTIELKRTYVYVRLDYNILQRN